MLRAPSLVACALSFTLTACGGESFSESTPEEEEDDDSASDEAANDDDGTSDATDDDVTDDDGSDDDGSDDDVTDDDGSGDDDSLGLVIGDEVSLEQLPAAISRAICARLFACCTEEERGDVGEDVDQCTVNTSVVLSLVYLGPITESQREGRLAYHGDRAADCLKEVDEAVCDEVPAALCLEAVEPLLESGEYCKHDVECIDGVCIDGTCNPPLALGTSCLEDPDCESGYCSTLTGTCARLGGVGEACSDNAHCQSGNCEPNNTCGAPIPAACQ